MDPEPSSSQEEAARQVVHPRCCGLDIQKKTVVACLLLTQPDGAVQRHTRTFSTMTSEWLALNDWLAEHDVAQVAMESTGIFRRPIFNLLEDGRTIILVNAQRSKAVPGRKTAVQDSEWIADPLRHGLLQASFIPQSRFANCANSRATGRPWCKNERRRSTAGRRCWKPRTSS